MRVALMRAVSAQARGVVLPATQPVLKKMFKIKCLLMFVVVLLGACGKDAPEPAQPAKTAPPAPTSQPAPAPVAAPAAEAPKPVEPAPAAEAAKPAAAEPAKAAAFSIENVPVSSATLGAFPYFSLPDGVSAEEQKGKVIDFDRRYFQAGEELVGVEGKVHERTFRLEQKDKNFSELEVHRNYENIIQQAGGVKTHAKPMTNAMVDKAGGNDQVRKYYHGPGPGNYYQHNAYVIRQPNKEIWVQIATGAIPLHAFVLVVERAAMAQTVGMLKADQLKKEIDAKGRVAVYINFDTDKADIKAESQPVIDEIAKLLQGDGGLRLSVEGHTDNTGTATRNQALSNERAQSVVAALTGKGIAKERLSAKGFGQDKPLADNGSESGRARNRRVELVKVTG